MALNQVTLVLCVLLSFCSTVAVGKSFMFLPDSSSETIGKTVKFDICNKDKEDAASIASVDITPCTTDPCEFKVGKNVSTTVVFTPKKRINGGKLEIFGILGPFTIKIKLPKEESNVCEHHNIKCPLEAGEEQKFIMSLVVKSYFPPAEVTIRADVLDENNEKVVCIQFKAKIKH